MEFIDVGAVDDVPSGQMRAVVIDGQPVVVVNVEGDVFAIGGMCSHENAELAQGAVDGHTVYCPRHFSAFDVRTGEVLGPPAELPIPTFGVRQEAGRILVSQIPREGATEPFDSAPEGQTEPAVEGREGASRDDVVQADNDNRPVSTLERAVDSRAVRGLTDAMSRVVLPAYQALHRLRLTDLLNGTKFLHHPVHPALSDLPIGFWCAALLMYAAQLPTAAIWLTIAGIAAAGGAIATGLADWAVTEARDRRIGAVHGLLNVVGTLMQGASAVAYFMDLRALAIVLAVLGVVVTLSAAYLGGHLVFGRAVMVDHTSWISGPQEWTEVVDLDELTDGGSQVVPLGNRKIIVHRRGQQLSAIEESCSHAGGPLGRGIESECLVRCPWHGSEFNTQTGEVLRGPATRPQPALQVRVRDGVVQVRQ